MAVTLQMGTLETLDEAIDRLLDQYDGLRPMCRALNLDPGYVHRLRSGEKTNPSEKTLTKLGLRKVTIYLRHEREPAEETA